MDIVESYTAASSLNQLGFTGAFCVSVGQLGFTVAVE